MQSFAINLPYRTRRLLIPLVLFALLGGFWTLYAWEKLDGLIFLLGYPPKPESFADTRVIEGAIRSLEHGYNPYVENRYDILRPPFNYPRLWLSLRFPTWGEAWIMGFCAGISIAFAVACWAVSRLIDSTAGLLVLGALCVSLPVLFHLFLTALPQNLRGLILLERRNDGCLYSTASESTDISI